MKSFLHAALVLGVSLVAHPRPLIIENQSTFGAPDAAYAGFGGDVAIDGDWALVTASRHVPDPSGDPLFDETYSTAFLFRRNGTTWTVVRRLEERRDIRDSEIPGAVAMRGGIAVVQTQRKDFYELTASGWTLVPSVDASEAPGRYLAIDGGRVLSGEGSCGKNARVFAKNSAGTWATAAVLPGYPRESGCDDEFRGGPADIAGNWAVAWQPDPEGQPPQAVIFRDFGGDEGWYHSPYGSALAPEGATRFGPEVALRTAPSGEPDVFVGGGIESGTYVYRESPAYGFELATRAQSLDSFMGAGIAGGLAHDDKLLLQQGFSHDHDAGVVYVYRENAGEYEHVATLVARNGQSLGGSIAISGRRVLVGSNANGLVYSFELPATFATPAVIQEDFTTGTAAAWTPSAGAGFALATSARTRVYRQSATGVFARAVLANSDFRAQAVEADIRPSVFATAGSGFGVVTRWQSPDNHFEALVRNTGRVELRRRAGGTLRILATAAFTPVVNRTYRVRLESIGTRHRVFVDGQLLAAADASGPSHGSAALVTDRAAADFDNVVVSPTPLTTIYSTDFENGDAGPWTHTGLGFWNLWSGASTVYNQSSVAGDARASIGVPADDQVVRVRTRLDTFASPTGTQERWFGVMARHSDASNYYYLALRSNDTIALRKVVNGVTTTLASSTFAVNPATWYRLRLDAVGDRLRAYVNGTLVLQARDGSHARGTAGPAMFKAAADFDDFSVVQP